MAHSIYWDNTTNKDFFKSLLWDVFDTTKREALYEAETMVKHIKTKDEYERRARIAGISGMEKLADGQNIPLAETPDPQTKEYEQERYGFGFEITAGMKKFNRYNMMKDLTAKLSKNMREEKDIEIAKMFNQATSTTADGAQTGFDGLALASDSHLCRDDAGSTYDNYLDAALGVSSFESATVYFDTLVDDDGYAIMKTPTHLFVNPQLRWEAREILGSELKPYTGDNTKNVAQDYGLSLFVYHRLTASTSWGMIAKDSDYDIFVMTTEEPDLKVQDAPNTSRNTIVTSHQWFKPGFGDPRAFFLGDA